MKDLETLVMNKKRSVIDILRKMESLTGSNKSLFIINDHHQMEGTLSDGDIRRGLILGYSINDNIDKFMNKDFTYITDINSPFKINEAKKRGIKLLPLIDENKKIKKIYNLTNLKSLLPVDAVIMAGGKGERLHPLTNKTPKPMLPLGKKPIIEHNIDKLISYGIENIYISINYLGEQIVNYFGDGSSKGINIQYIKEEKPLGTAGSLSLVKKFKNKHIILMNSDLFTDVDLFSLYNEMISKKASIVISSIPYTINIPFAILKKSKSQIIGIEEKPQYNNYANAGIYLIETDILNKIPKNSVYDAPDLITDVIKSGKKVIDVPITGYWIDIGRKEEYEKAKELIKHI